MSDPLDLDALEKWLRNETEAYPRRLTTIEALALIERVRRAEGALRYIAGYDEAGYEGHLRSDSVARAYLAAIYVDNEGDRARAALEEQDS